MPFWLSVDGMYILSVIVLHSRVYQKVSWYKHSQTEQFFCRGVKKNASDCMVIIMPFWFSTEKHWRACPFGSLVWITFCLLLFCTVGYCNGNFRRVEIFAHLKCQAKIKPYMSKYVFACASCTKCDTHQASAKIYFYQKVSWYKHSQDRTIFLQGC